MTEEQKQIIQNFGEQHPDFFSDEMKLWRHNWCKCKEVHTIDDICIEDIPY